MMTPVGGGGWEGIRGGNGTLAEPKEGMMQGKGGARSDTERGGRVTSKFEQRDVVTSRAESRGGATTNSKQGVSEVQTGSQAKQKTGERPLALT